MGWLFIGRRIIPIEPPSVKAFSLDDNKNGIIKSDRWGDLMESYAGLNYMENKLSN